MNQYIFIIMSLVAVAQPKSTEEPDYPHNYHAIPMCISNTATTGKFIDNTPLYRIRKKCAVHPT